MPDDNDEYRVGYGKPPKHTQFKKGNSGNPFGRPTKSKTELEHDPSSILAEPITVRTRGQTKQMSALEAGLRKKTQEALNTTSTRKLLKTIDMFEKAGLVRRPNESKHHPVLVIARRWDAGEFFEKFLHEGPPPWDGPDDGLPYSESKTHTLEEYRRQCNA